MQHHSFICKKTDKQNLIVIIEWCFSVFLQMCIAGALGIPGPILQRPPSHNCFVSKKVGLSVTAWGYCVQYGKNVIDLRVNLPEFPRMSFYMSCFQARWLSLSNLIFTHMVV